MVLEIELQFKWEGWLVNWITKWVESEDLKHLNPIKPLNLFS